MPPVIDLRPSSGCRGAPLPAARGPITAQLLAALTGPAPHPGEPPSRPVHEGAVASDDPLLDEDLQLALYLCYELHYRGLAGVDELWEWESGLLGLRSRLEQLFRAALEAAVAPVPADVDAPVELWSLAHGPAGRSLSGHMAEAGTLAEMRELGVHRSAYQLKEADPHTWAIPRLDGRAKASMVEIQHDEYGCGRVGESHAALFAVTMEELGLDPAYGAYVERVPAVTLATVNLVSMLGLHRRLRGGLVGHLALFEMTSVGPMGRYSAALARLGLGGRARRFYDVHVAADAHHEKIALRDMVAGLLESEPELAPDVVAGARWLTELERRFSDHVLDCWSQGRTSLYDRPPYPSARSASSAGGGVVPPAPRSALRAAS